jgi:chemotaxis protein MotB
MGLRRKKHQEHENNERWLVSYADFITLLFAFFVVLYATSEADVRKQKELEQKLQQQFSGFFGSGQPEGDFNTDSRATSLIQPPLPTFPPPGSGVQEVQDHVERKLKKEMSEEEYDDVVSAIRHDAYGVRIQLAASSIFPSGSSELRPESVLVLEKIGRLLRDSKRKVLIEGHTDNEPVRGTRYPSNWELSAERATKIARFLVSRLKVDPSRVIPIAYSSNKPVSTNDTPEGRAKNRRIEILIINEDEAGF